MRESGISQSYLSEAFEKKRSFLVQLAQQGRRMSSLALGSQRSIRVAAANGYEDAVRSLLGDPRVDPTAYGNFAIRAAAANGHTETVKVLLGDPRVDPSARQNQALRLASTYGHLAIVRLLLADHRELQPRGTGQALQCACVRGHDAVAEALLADPRVRVDFPTRDARGVLQGAAQRGNLALLERLLADPRITACEGAVAGAVATAGKAGALPAVEQLLREPTAEQQLAANDGGLYYAAEQGHVAVVKRLLAAPRLHFDFERVASAAVESGCVETVSVLLADPRCPPRRFATAFLQAVHAGHAGVVHQLLAALGPAQHRLASALTIAAARGHEDIVRLVLADSRLSLSALELDFAFMTRHGVQAAAGVVALEAACFYGHIAVAEALLADARLDLAAACLPALKSAAAQRHVAVVERLLADTRVAAAVPAAAASAFFQSAAASSAISQPVGDEQEDADDDEAEAAAAKTEGVWANASDSEDLEGPAGGLRPGFGFLRAASSPLTESVLARDATKQFFRAVRAGDVARVRELLADPLLDPQAPKEGSPEHWNNSPEDYYCERTCDLALAEAAESGRVALLDLLLADPCWEPRHVTAALSGACNCSKAAVVERLLADPRVELTAMPERDSEGSCFMYAAMAGCAKSLRLLLADAGLHGVDKAAAGREVLRGLRAMEPRVAYSRARPALQQTLRVPSVLHACLAASAAAGNSGFPSFMRNLIDAAAIGQQAWARRRLLVAARVRVLEEE